MSILLRHDTVTTTRILPFPTSIVLPIIHSPSDMIHLNPLVISASPSPTDPLEWEIVDRLSFGGFLSWNSRYTARFELTETGQVCSNDAGAGVSLRNTWSCVPAGEAGASSEVTETAEITAPIFVIGYVVSTLKSSHQTLMEQLEKEVRKRTGKEVNGAQAAPKE